MAKKNNQTSSSAHTMLAGLGVSVTPESVSMFKSVSVNIKQECIVITRDKLELVLRDHLIALEHKRSWLPPAALCLSTTLALVTSTFQERFSVSAPLWQAMFILVAAASGIRAIYLLWKYWGATSSVQAVINTLVAAGGTVQLGHTESDQFQLPKTPSLPLEPPTELKDR